MECRSCGKENGGNSKFCVSCGNELNSVKSEKRICNNCGFTNETDCNFCVKCGTKLDVTVLTYENHSKPISKHPIESITKVQGKNIKKPKSIKFIIAAIASVVAFVIFSIVIFFIVVFGMSNRAKFDAIGCFMKDGNLYINYADSFESRKITKK